MGHVSLPPECSRGERVETASHPCPEPQQRRVDGSGPTTLDEIIPVDEQIALIKIDAEGAELPIIRGGLATIRRCRPLIIFETGRGTTPFYGVGPDDIFDTVVGNLEMSLSTMSRWLEGKGSSYTKAGFRKNFEHGKEFYFIAY
jgi:hypothetical protein